MNSWPDTVSLRAVGCPILVSVGDGPVVDGQHAVVGDGDAEAALSQAHQESCHVGCHTNIRDTAAPSVRFPPHAVPAKPHPI